MVPPEETGRPRQLRAILHADMVGYSAITAASAERALRCVTAINGVFAEVVPEHNGEFQASAGDSFLALFSSAVDAVAAGMKIQRRLARSPQWFGEALRLRIGINMGEVTWTALGLLGDAINVAARIQAEADPGGIAVSDSVYLTVRNQIDIEVAGVEAKVLKNVGEVRFHKVLLQPGSTTRFRARFSRRQVVAAATVLGIGAPLAYVLTRPRLLTTTLHEGHAPPSPQASWPLSIAVMEIATPKRDEVPEWMCDMTQQGLNAFLSNFDQLQVFSTDQINWVRRPGQPPIEVAKALGATKMLNGTFLRADSRLTLEMRIVDIATGFQQGACRGSGTENQLVAIQNDVGVKLVRALKVPVTPEEVDRVIAARTNVDRDVTKRYADAFGGTDDDTAPQRVAPPGARWFSWPPRAYAAGPADEESVKLALERYRSALESKSLDQVAAIYVSLGDNTRQALDRYFQSAADLKVRFSGVSVLFDGDEALATFTRSDQFKDVETGRDVNLEVRVSTVVAKQGDAWKIKALRKPS